jgi:hypothetical protein
MQSIEVFPLYSLQILSEIFVPQSVERQPNESTLGITLFIVWNDFCSAQTPFYFIFSFSGPQLGGNFVPSL